MTSLRHRLKTCLALLWLAVWGSGVCAAETMVDLALLGKEGSVVLGPYLGHFEDRSARLGIADVSAPGIQASFVSPHQERPNFGYSVSGHWLRFTLPRAADNTDYLLQVSAPTLDQVEVFTLDSQGAWVRQSAGDMRPWAERPFPHRHFIFRIKGSAKADSTYYVRAASSTAVTVPLILWRPEAFDAEDRTTTLFLGLFYGLLFAQFLYNLVIYVSLRDQAYLLYVVYVASFGLSLAIFDGLAFQYLWPTSVRWANHALPTMLSATLLFGALFSREFLSPQKFAPMMGRIMLVFALCCGILILPSATGWWLEPRQSLLAITWLALCGAPLVLWTAYRAIAQGFRPARYFLLAWSGLLGFMWLSALRNFQLVPVNFLSANGLHIGLALDAILLSTALADRIRLMRDEMIGAQTKLIDASRQYQAVLEHRAKELAAANRELEEFSHTVAHDLRSPLRAIDGFSHLIQEEAKDKLGPDAQRDLGLISSNARKMAGLIDGLLDFSRIGRRTPDEQPVNMQELAAAVVKDAAHAGVDIRIGKLDPVRGDALLLKQALTNLIENAIKFSAKNPSPEVSVECTRSEREIIYSVRDNGAGFDMQYADKLFGMFQRLHAPNEFEGTGVGLAIVKRVMERHGGRVWAASTPGAGATFYFALPIERLAENP